MKQHLIFCIVPCYNEEEVLPITLKCLKEVWDGIVQARPEVMYAILLVDDGSKDRTWTLIREAAIPGVQVIGLKLAHNVGHQYALWAGMEWASQHEADAIVTIDADLQDDVQAIPRMVDRYLEGFDIVYGVRKERATDSAFKRQTALRYYDMMRALGTDLVHNHADYRLLGGRALHALMQYPERNMFLRGMVRLLGFREAYVYYDRKARAAGVSKYPLRKMLQFAMEGLTSFSVKPLRIIALVGVLCIALALFVAVYAFVVYAAGNAMPGWTSILLSIWFVGGAILVAMGILGEYVGKIYTEVKRRPRYFVEALAGDAHLLSKSS